MTAILALFGAPAMTVGGAARALDFERRTQLLVYLALKRTWVGRAEIAGLLWPDQNAKLAYTNLRKALHRLQSLAGGEGIETQGSALRFETETDVQAFESALHERRDADALALYRGDLLRGFDDGANDAWTGWLDFERNRLRTAWRAAAQRRLAAMSDPGEAIDLAARLLDADPLDEDALRHFVQGLVHAGQLARARRACEDYAARLQSELGLAPSADLTALLGSTAGTARPARGDARPSRGARDDGFVGRTVELRRIAALLAQDDCRLLSVIGPGGVGKTRLAQRVVDEFAAHFEGGATFVPLDDLLSASELGSRLARELDVTLKARGEPLDQVIDALRPTERLLVLDNFEHLTDGAPRVERLLAECPRVKAVVTSRVRLAVAAEWLLPLEGLPCPDDEDVDHIESFDAARLFVRSARRVRPDFAPANEAAAIIDICRQVEGLPLALELAAAWTRVLSCDAVARELRQGTELLHTVDATQPARHASFDVVFDQSWRLLAGIERDVLARLSVFSGSFTPEAARVVANARLPVLGALADKSLLRKDDARLRLHPLVSQLAGQRLAKGAARAQAQAAHANYFHRLLGELQPAAASGDRDALARVDDDFENCRVAWFWSIEHRDVDSLARSSATLLHYCDFRGRATEGLRLLDRALDALASVDAAGLRALLQSRAAHLEYRLDRYAEAEARASHALEVAHRSRDSAARLQALNVLGTCAVRLGRLEDARRYFKLRLDGAGPNERAHTLAVTLDHLALIEKRLGHYEEARRLSLQSLDHHRHLGDRAGEALCLNNLGSLLVEMNRSADAVAPLREGLAICDRDGLVTTRGLILSNLADAAFGLDRLDEAEPHARRAIDTATASGNRAVLASMHRLLGSIAVKKRDLEAARSALARSLALAIELGSPAMIFEPVIEFAELLRTQGELVAARRVLAVVAHQPGATQNIRNQIAAVEAAIPVAAADTRPQRPRIDFDELTRRIVAEQAVAHAPLIAALNDLS